MLPTPAGNRPATSTQPQKVSRRAPILRGVIGSWKQSAESSITKTGEVYSRTAATDRALSEMALK